MADFRLKVFSEVKKYLNFSKAAEALFVSQPSVSKHIRLLEEELGVTLFERSGSGVKLTAEGAIFANFSDEILEKYDEAKFQLSTFGKGFEGVLRLGASTTLAQYVLPEILAEFIKKYPNITLDFKNANTEEIENLLIEKKIDLGFIEGISGRKNLKYREIGKDELVCVVRAGHPLSSEKPLAMQEILNFPWLLRESGSGSLEVLNGHLKTAGIRRKDIKIEAFLGATESIKSYLKFSDCIGFLSVFSVKQDLLHGQLKILEIQDFEVLREFYSVELQGVQKSIVKLFSEFLTNNQKL